MRADRGSVRPDPAGGRADPARGRSDPSRGRARTPALAAAVAALLLGPPAGLAGQGGMEEVEVTATHVAGSVYMVQGRGGNIGVSAGEDGVLLVDDQFAPLADRIRAAIGRAARGGAGPVPADSVEFVLNTHWHGDHVGGNEVFGRHAHIVAHANVRARLSRPQVVRGDTVAPKPDHALPVVTFRDGLTVHFNGEPVRVVHVPHGHTDGDAVVLFTGSNVIHMGDQMFAGRFPFVDLATGGTVEGYVRNVERVLETVGEVEGITAEAHVIPGHGPLTDVGGLRRFHGMLEETVRIVRDRLEAGTSLEEAKSAGLPSKWREWGQGFISTGEWIETIYRSYSGEAASAGDATRLRHVRNGGR